MAVADQAEDYQSATVPSEIHRFPSGCPAGRTATGDQRLLSARTYRHRKGIALRTPRLGSRRPVIVRLSGGHAAPERALEPDQIPVGISYKELTHAGFLLADPVPLRFGLHEQLDPCRSQR